MVTILNREVSLGVPVLNAAPAGFPLVLNHFGDKEKMFTGDFNNPPADKSDDGVRGGNERLWSGPPAASVAGTDEPCIK